MIGVDPSCITKNLTYKYIIVCEAIKEGIFEHKTTTYETQSYNVSGCNEQNEEEEDDEKNIDKEKMTQYEEEEQPYEPEAEL
jgi:hypothetical protein